jgi:hypothetical protein
MYQDLEAAYGVMAELGYRPGASSDGCGHITGPLNLVKESRDYAEMWAEEEHKGRFFIGTPKRNRAELVLVVEAARLICARVLGGTGGTKDHKLALRLLRKAVARLEKEARFSDRLEGTFDVESDLQKQLRAHIEQLEPGLKIIDGGRERTLQTGRVDILAEDRNQNIVVIELKTGEATEREITQILRYTGELVSTGRQVRGILVAGAFSRRARAAASQVQDLQLRKYSFNFAFGAD